MCNSKLVKYINECFVTLTDGLRNGLHMNENQSHDQPISIFPSFIHYIIVIINDDYL